MRGQNGRRHKRHSAPHEPWPPEVARQFASLMGLRGQADYNRPFIMDAAGFHEEMGKAEALFDSLDAYLAERGIRED